MTESLPVTREVEIATWKLGYTQVFPATYRGGWVRYRMDFESSTEMTAEEWIARAQGLLQGKVIPLFYSLWQAAEPKSKRWLIDVGLAPDPGAYPDAQVSPSFAWSLLPGILWGITGLIGAGGLIYSIFAKDSQQQPPPGSAADVISAVVPMMMVFVLLSMMPAMVGGL